MSLIAPAIITLQGVYRIRDCCVLIAERSTTYILIAERSTTLERRLSRSCVLF
ncbi:hypothetical protein RMSM_05152 [Rhodopirellula maiorica SM1]|uniref:Uncharacterized protein n=1 Tax=Rhodopirellula maiorica SM1 TaxID=1265738 RepID=M5RFQ3_9BACT|nr:hypothetical protein RMSM_05152 [Rhodopirellula maiorica SM1]